MIMSAIWEKHGKTVSTSHGWGCSFTTEKRWWSLGDGAFMAPSFTNILHLKFSADVSCFHRRSGNWSPLTCGPVWVMVGETRIGWKKKEWNEWNEWNGLKWTNWMNEWKPKLHVFGRCVLCLGVKNTPFFIGTMSRLEVPEAWDGPRFQPAPEVAGDGGIHPS